MRCLDGAACCGARGGRTRRAGLETGYDQKLVSAPVTGEQQRLAFARILLVEPALLFLDEATSALDEPSEAQLYGLLRAASWRPTVISVGHRSTLCNFHDHVL